jgi:hypothetical protein
MWRRGWCHATIGRHEIGPARAPVDIQPAMPSSCCPATAGRPRHPAFGSCSTRARLFAFLDYFFYPWLGPATPSPSIMPPCPAIAISSPAPSTIQTAVQAGTVKLYCSHVLFGNRIWATAPLLGQAAIQF